MTTYSNIRYAAAGVTEYATADDLPTTAASGSQAFVAGTNRLYIWNGTGWYNIALINTNPTISGVSASYQLATDGTATTVTITASDPEGLPITYSLASDTSGSVATVTQGTGASTNVFTITPSTSSANSGTFTLTFRASDGVNLASAPAEFSLEFSVVNSHYTSALITSVGVNNAVNNTFIDSSSNSHTITASGDATQTTFSPYRHGGYSIYHDGTGGDYIKTDTSADFAFGSNDFTVECWYYPVSKAQNYPRILHFGEYWSNSRSWGLLDRHNSTNTKFTVQSFALGTILESTTTVSNNQWYHLAVVRSGGTITLYVNGAAEGTYNISTNNYPDASSTSYLSLLNVSDGSNLNEAQANGHLTDVRVIQGTAVYASAFTPPAERLTVVTNTSLLIGNLPYLADGSTNNHTLTSNGNPSMQPFTPYDYTQYSSATNGGSIYFDGNSDAIEIADNDAFDFGTGDLTIECWVYPKETGNNFPGFLGSVSGWGSQAASGFRFDNLGDSKFQMSWYGPGDPFIESQSTFAHNQWYHFVVTRTGGNTWRMFVNGILEDVGTNSTAYDICVGGTSFQMGGKTWDGGNGWFNGNVADVRLTKGSVVTEYQTSSTTVGDKIFTPRTTPISSSGSELHLKGANAGIIDKSQSVKTITLNGDVKSSTTQSKYLTSSMYFDGAADYITLSDSDLREFGGNNFTMEFWIKTTISTQYATIISRTPSGFAAGMWTILMNNTVSGGEVAMYLGDLTGNLIFATSGASIRDDSWHHVAVVRNGSTFTCYIDGTSRGSGTWAGSITNINGDIRIGMDQNYTRYFEGYLSDVRITKGLARYTAAFTPPTAALKG